MDKTGKLRRQGSFQHPDLGSLKDVGHGVSLLLYSAGIRRAYFETLLGTEAGLGVFLGTEVWLGVFLGTEPWLGVTVTSDPLDSMIVR